MAKWKWIGPEHSYKAPRSNMTRDGVQTSAGGGASMNTCPNCEMYKAMKDGVQLRIADLEAENAKLRELLLCDFEMFDSLTEPLKTQIVKPLLEGIVIKGGQNVPTTSQTRPPTPGGSGGKTDAKKLKVRIAELQAENAKLRELANPIGDSSEKQQAQAWVYVWRTLEKLGVHGFLGGTNAMTKAAEFINAIFAENAKLRGDVAMLRTTVKCLHDLAKERARNTTADYAANDAARKDGAK